MERRKFLDIAVRSTAAATVLRASASEAASAPQAPIIDAHQHLWDLEKLHLPWVREAPAVLRHSFRASDYRAATAGLDIQGAVYLEVDAEPKQHQQEAEQVIAWARDRSHPTVAGVISGRCDQASFADYIRPLAKHPEIKGVRHLLEAAPRGTCLSAQFTRSVQLLGELGLSFDLTMPPRELEDGLTLVKRCPETKFVIDHCGVADPKAFLPAHRASAMHEAEAWKRSMHRLAARPNTVCKISGIVAHVPTEWSSADLAPIIDHCLEEFGPDRVLFGSDWPVCLLGASLKRWVQALREVTSSRPAPDQRKLWRDNAMKHYRLELLADGSRP